MWATSRRRCGSGLAQLQASLVCNICKWWHVPTRLCDEASLVASLYSATRCMALRPGVARPAIGFVASLCALLWTAWGRLGRRFNRRRRSTRTSAAGTPRLSRASQAYASLCRRTHAARRNRRPSRSSGPGSKWSRRRCGDGPPRMWASPGVDVGDVQAQMWVRLG
jgi:hypothetical protein